ncbi:MAG TPA: alpha/beta hydrolase, partial [Blastocatellia bacterium]|nr:alpha/beta hydrolase [Blastocatellia bacterium]
RKEVNAKQIGLVGHSDGGLVAPIAASRSKDVAFIVLMAGTGLPGEEILYLQGALIAKANGATEAMVERNRRLQQIMFRALKEEKDDVAVRQRIKADFAKMTAGSPTEQEQSSSAMDAEIDMQLKRLLTTWFRYFLTYDPRPALTRVQVPVLAINGELDLQVPADANLAAIEKALKAGGNKDHTIVKLPRLNHLFQTSQTGSPAEYVKIDETIAPVALQTISDWIVKQTK